MSDNSKKLIYYISDINNGLIYIIDGETYHIIKEVEVGPRPQNIVVDKRKNLYIASDRNGKITLINDLYNIDRIFDMPNNGNIEVSYINQKIYVSNAYEVCVYDLMTEKKIKCIDKFTAADGLELDNINKKLFVLDILQNEIKVYNTENFNLIKTYKDNRIQPKFMLLENSGSYLYIANKAVSRNRNNEILCILNIEDECISEIYLDKGSEITSLEENGRFLYAVNSGLKRIEIIDIVDKKSILFIKTTLLEIQKIRLSPDKDILVATSTSNEGKGVIDIISLTNNKIIKTIEIKHENSNPYDIGIIAKNKCSLKMNSEEINNHCNEGNNTKKVTALIKRILWSNEDKVIFNNIYIKLDLDKVNIIWIEEVKFRKCEPIDILKNIVSIDSIRKYCILNYKFYIPFYIVCKDNKDERHVIEGRLEGTQSVKIYMSDFEKYQDTEFVIKSLTTVEGIPTIIDDIVNFNASSVISTMVVIEEIKDIYSIED